MRALRLVTQGRRQLCMARPTHVCRRSHHIAAGCTHRDLTKMTRVHGRLTLRSRQLGSISSPVSADTLRESGQRMRIGDINRRYPPFPGVPAMVTKTALAILMTMLVPSAPALADCVTVHFHFFGHQTVATSESLSSGDTCFHGLHNNPKRGNVFNHIDIVQHPSHGRLSITNASAFQYRSSAGYRGPDSYAVRICMGSSNGPSCSVVVFNASIH
jgi:hypothetical protein